MRKYYSLRELSVELDIPKSTIVKYKDFFSDHLKMAGDGKRKKFEGGALEVLRDIRAMREEKKLDWDEIKYELNEKYGEPQPKIEPEQKASASAPPPAVIQQSSRIDYLEHMISLLGSQVMRVAELVDQTRRAGDNASRQIVEVSARLAKLDGKLDVVLGNLLSRDESEHAASRRHLADLKADLRTDLKREFDRISVMLAHVRESIGTEAAPVQENRSESSFRMDELNSKIEKQNSDHTLLQNKYQVLLVENELLKTKLREKSSQQVEMQPEEPRRSGWLSKRRRD